MSRSIARARAGRDRTSLYQEITDEIIAELEAGRVPWVQPWGTAAAKASLTMPKHAATHRFITDSTESVWGRPERPRRTPFTLRPDDVQAMSPGDLHN